MLKEFAEAKIFGKENFKMSNFWSQKSKIEKLKPGYLQNHEESKFSGFFYYLNHTKKSSIYIKKT